MGVILKKEEEKREAESSFREMGAEGEKKPKSHRLFNIELRGRTVALLQPPKTRTVFHRGIYGIIYS